MKVLLVAWKSLVEISREIQLLVLTVALPLIFLAITALTYNHDLLSTYRLVVRDQTRQAGVYLAAIQNQRYPGGEVVFEVMAQSQVDSMASEAELIQTDKATAVVSFTHPGGNAANGGYDLRGRALHPVLSGRCPAGEYLDASCRKGVGTSPGGDLCGPIPCCARAGDRIRSVHTGDDYLWAVDDHSPNRHAGQPGSALEDFEPFALEPPGSGRTAGRDQPGPDGGGRGPSGDCAGGCGGDGVQPSAARYPWLCWWGWL